MSKAPFPNEYRVRLVAESDAKACSICYRPCTTVLLNSTQMDFLYTCESHLKDSQFAIPIKLDEYLQLQQQKLQLENKITKLKQEKELNKPYVWNKISDYWSSSKSDNKGSSDKKDTADKADENKKDVSENLTTPTEKYNAIVKQLATAESELAELNKSIEGYKFKEYNLHQHFYKARITAYVNSKLNKIKRDKITQQDFFPQVPAHDLTPKQP